MQCVVSDVIDARMSSAEEKVYVPETRLITGVCAVAKVETSKNSPSRECSIVRVFIRRVFKNPIKDMK